MNDERKTTARAEWGITIRRFLVTFLPLLVVLRIILGILYYVEIERGKAHYGWGKMKRKRFEEI